MGCTTDNSRVSFKNGLGGEVTNIGSVSHPCPILLGPNAPYNRHCSFVAPAVSLVCFVCFVFRKWCLMKITILNDYSAKRLGKPVK